MASSVTQSDIDALKAKIDADTTIPDGSKGQAAGLLYALTKSQFGPTAKTGWASDSSNLG